MRVGSIMGACQSCLGQRDMDTFEEDESRLLYDDENAMHYGSFADCHGGDESIESQRENEALQQVVAKTSSNMVDVFEIAPPLQQHALFAGRSAGFMGYASREGIIGGGARGGGVRSTRYHHLVSKLSSEQVDNQPPAGIQVDWLTEDDGGGGGGGEDERSYSKVGGGVPQSGRRLGVKTGGDGPLVGTFADAAAAMD